MREKISSQFIAKIEGHGRLNINLKKNQVRLEILEGERLFEGLMVGRKAEEAPWITSRICGVCPISHNLASLKAIESALEIDPPFLVKTLRKLMLIAQIIQSHSLHLYFLALPDYLNLDNSLSLSKTHPQIFKDALTLKDFSDRLAEIIAGRRVHPTTTAIGGFHKEIKRENFKKILSLLDKSLEAAKNTVRLFASLNYPKIEKSLVFLSLYSGEDYAIYDGEFLVSNFGLKTSPVNYKRFIEEKVKNYSTAKFGSYQGKGLMVGALARLNLQNQFLNPLAKKMFKKIIINFKNPYYNNLAQAVEILHFVEEIRKILEDLLKKKEWSTIASLKKNSFVLKRGIGFVEAPRGTLYHEYKIDECGFIQEANIVTPTVQNLSSIERVAQKILDTYKNLEGKKKVKLIEMLIRAYDPCLTCSVH